MHLRERDDKNFHSAALIIATAKDKRDKELHPKIVRVWRFFQKYVANSDSLDWSSKSACKATTREIKDAAFNCKIHTALNTPEDWSAMITIMNMDNKKYKVIAKQMSEKQKLNLDAQLKMPPSTQSPGKERTRTGGLRVTRAQDKPRQNPRKAQP